MKWFATWPIELREALLPIATDIVDGAAILGATGLLAGYFPARDAARLDPVVAMKL